MSQAKKEWIATKQEVKERDGYCCQLCLMNIASNLSVHHILPKSMGGQNTEDNCITLCVDCHRGFHKVVEENNIHPVTLTPLDRLKKKIK